MTTVTEVTSKGLNILIVGGITAIIIVLLFIVGAIIESVYVRRQFKNRTHLQKCVALKKDDLVRFDGCKLGLVVTNVQHVEHALIREKNKPTGILKVDYKRINEVCKK